MQILTCSDNQVSVHLKNSLDISYPIQIAEFDLCECGLCCGPVGNPYLRCPSASGDQTETTDLTPNKLASIIPADTNRYFSNGSRQYIRLCLTKEPECVSKSSSCCV